MQKLFFIVLFGIFFIGCSNDGTDSSSVENQKQYLSISKAPINSEVSIVQKINLWFSTDLNTSSVTDDSAYITDELGNHVSLNIDIESTKILFTPYQYFQPSHTYTIVITTAVKSSLGLSLSKDYNFSFTTSADTVDNSPMAFEDIKPSNNSVADIKTDITIEFSKNISADSQYSGVEPILVIDDADGAAIEGSIEYFNSMIIFKPSAELKLNSSYSVSLVGGVSDMYGNTYKGATSWNFTTGAVSLKSNVGYKALYTYDLNKTNASIIRSVKSYDGNITLAVASEKTIDLYNVFYDANHYPYIEAKPNHSYTLPSQINAMNLANDMELVSPDLNITGFTNQQYIGVATMSNGVYSLKVEANGISEFFHLSYTTPIYDIAYNTVTNPATPGIVYAYKSYAVGPEYGLSMVLLDPNTGGIVLSDHAAVNGTPLKVVTTRDETNSSVVYVSDYSGKVLKFDENCIPLNSVDLNGSTRNLAVTHDTNGSQNGILAFNSLGKGTHLELDTNLTKKGYTSILSSVSDLNSFAAWDNNSSYHSRVHISDPSNGLIVLNSDANLTLEGLINSDGHIVSSTFFGDYIATLDQEGTINIFNSISDTKGPFFAAEPLYDVNSSDANVTLEFDEYLNPSTISKDSFTFINLNTWSFVDFSFITTDDPRVYILKANSTLDVAKYVFTVSETIEDMVGNGLDGGDYPIPFEIK